MAGLERARRYADKRKRRGRGGFTPFQLSKVVSWLRLASSSQSGGEWTPSIVDVINAGNPVTQTDTDRRTAVGASANGLPTMVFDGSDVHVWPLSNSINNMTTKIGYWWWYKPATVTGTQRQLTVASTGGASLNKIQTYASGATWRTEIYISGNNGRVGTTPAATLTAGAWHALYLQYDSSRGGDANLVKYINGVAQSLTMVDQGAGGTLTVLQQPTGNMIIGGFNDSDTPTNPIVNLGEWGPNVFIFNDNLTAAEIAAILAFERPT